MTPDTSGYLLLGLTAIATIIGIYSVSLVYRLRKTAQQLEKITVGK